MCVHSYGEQTSIMRIIKLTPTEYKEEAYRKNIIDTRNVAYKEGGHQFNPALFNNKCIVATDNRSKNYSIIELFRRIWKIARL